MKESVSLEAMIKRWPSALVAREKVGEFSGGVLHPRTMANADSLGEGPPGRMKMGRKIFYRAEDLADWIEQRTEILN